MPLLSSVQTTRLFLCCIGGQDGSLSLRRGRALGALVSFLPLLPISDRQRTAPCFAVSHPGCPVCPGEAALLGTLVGRVTLDTALGFFLPTRGIKFLESLTGLSCLELEKGTLPSLSLTAGPFPVFQSRLQVAQMSSLLHTGSAHVVQITESTI